MKKKIILFNILTPFFVVFILCAAICVPRYLLIQKYDTLASQIHAVPEAYYLASNTAMAKRASELLSATDKMKLITGVWDSEYEEIPVSEATISESKAVEMAKNQLEYLFALNLFPDSVKSSYNNWYSWSSKVYSYSEQSFHTYTCNLWEITFEKYDKSMKHTILMTEDGIILQATSTNTDKTLARAHIKISQDVARVLLDDRGIRMHVKKKIDNLSNLPNQLAKIYPDQNQEIMINSSIAQTTLSHFDNPKEEYIFYQYNTNKHYVFGMIELDALSKK